jgi:hypothetical protein
MASSITEIVSGGARGADRLGERYARQRGLPCKVFPAQWVKWQKRRTFQERGNGAVCGLWRGGMGRREPWNRAHDQVNEGPRLCLASVIS